MEITETKNKSKIIIALALFAVFFGSLLTLASFFDLKISEILTQNSLKAGEYISSSAFALFFEAVGAGVVYILLSIAGVIAFWFGFRNKNKVAKCIYCALGIVLAIVPMFLFFKDIFSYVGEYVGARLTSPGATDILIDNASELSGSLYVQAICGVLSFGYCFMLFALWQRVSPQKNNKLIGLSYVVVCTFALYLIIEFVKSPWGRVRYRAMNYLGDFGYYTNWYQINGKRKLFDLVGAQATNTRFNFVGDACKSFPSGHTFSAGIVYCLLSLPYLTDKFSKKSSRALLWAACIAYTGLVAISRIVAGAHFLSDVLVGGTISFFGAMLFREIFACKGKNVRALFARKVVESSLSTQETQASDNSQPIEENGEPAKMPLADATPTNDGCAQAEAIDTRAAEASADTDLKEQPTENIPASDNTEASK